MSARKQRIALFSCLCEAPGLILRRSTSIHKNKNKNSLLETIYPKCSAFGNQAVKEISITI